jgi:ribosomal protein S18 acetylase RimI-like enzyme
MVYMIDVDGEPAASGILTWRDSDPDLCDGHTTAHLSNLIVDPRFQGRGLGSRLIAVIEDAARERGFTRITIGVDATNDRARRLYERKGYAWLKDKTEAWGLVHYLWKPLQPSYALRGKAHGDPVH